MAADMRQPRRLEGWVGWAWRASHRRHGRHPAVLPLVGAVAGGTFVLIAPLLLFSPKLADLANAFDVVRSMRLLPIARTHALFLLGAAALPAVPLLLFVVPFDQLVIRSVQVLLGI